MCQSRRLSQMEPRLIVQVETIITSKEEETCDKTVQRRCLEVIVTLSHPQRLLHQQIPRHEIGARQTIESERITRYSHPRLNHHKRTQRRQQTVCIDILIRIHRLLFESSAVEDRQSGIHVREEELDAVLDHIVRQEARRGRKTRTTWRTIDAVQSIRDFGGEGGLSLCLSQFADHFGSGALGTLLLRDGVVGTR